LDGLRGIAAFLIAFIYHYTQFKPTVYPFAKLFYWPYNFGWTLINLFYVLSGFIFFQKYTAPISERTLTLKKYCILRFSRLYPLHWLTLLTVALFVLIRHFSGLAPFQQEAKNNIQLFLLNIPLIQYGWVYSDYKSFNGNSWTLSIEIMMYLLFFILAYCTRKNRKILLGSVGFVCLGVLLGVVKQLGFNFSILGVCQGMIGFFMGCVTAGIYNYCQACKETHAIVITLCVFLISLSIFFSAAPGFWPFFSRILAYSDMGYWIIVYTFLLFPALVFLTLHITFLTQIFSLRPLRYLGKISYSIYLIHFPIMLIIATINDYFALKIDYSNYIVFFSYMAFVMLSSHFSHFHFEIPCQNHIRKKYAAR
jgi:peptidoglycan/LPS O-acetylase OafA/YrhL